jgi:phenylalanyl-tRNA synthetase beta chain
MKFTLSWLKEYLDITVSTDEIIEKLTSIGLEVEEVENKAEIFSPFSVAKVISAEQHPDADRLRVCQVETKDGMVQVVCGAPNARAGMTGIFAPVGSHIPGLDVTLEKGKIRGQDSLGMLVSEREMSLSDEHDGIIDLDDTYSIGTPITDIFDGLDDVIIEIGLTPNRPDCASILGIARDLSVAGCGIFKLPEQPSIKGNFKSTVNVHTDTPDTCPHFMGRTIKGLKNGESPDWLKAKLESIGLRPISILVDITNYFCIGLNRPLHVYDVAKLQGDIRVQQAKSGEAFDALNDKPYTLKGGETVITDDSGVLGMGGIVGGVSTGCEVDTTDVFLECAYFDPTHTATTGRMHQVITDARYRFERGIDPEFTSYGLDLATQMILDLCGGEASEYVEAGSPSKWQKSYEFDTSLTEKRTGVVITESEQIEILKSLGFEIEENVSLYNVAPPSWRPDIMGVADLIEEIIRIYGYDKIESSPLPRLHDLTENALSKTHELRMYAGRTLANCGMQECVTWSFMQYDLATQFAEDIKPSLRLTNAISVEMDTMRPSILPNLIQVAAKNADRGYGNAALFEVGPIFHGVNPDDQMTVAAGVRHGVQNAKHWASSDISRSVDAYDAKVDAVAVIQSVNPSLNPQISADAPGHYHPGRSGTFRLGKNVLATFGEIHPAILEKIDITGPVVGFEVFLDNIPMPKKTLSARPSLELSQYQPVTRDFAFLVDEDVSAENIVGAAKKGGGAMVNDVRIFDVYQGQGVPEGQKSIAIAMQFIPTGKTLTDKDIEELSQSIVNQVTAKTNAVLRG